ncbi:hypothetical protein NDU88_010379 [Pleurodeles waltl]|uniref:Uncharacterized protein n=1 Tax=Pleurodeles waltl TaxID=8319 RepID=A0AAV7S1R5_PLEWA|nr:hypothetical protein NDU88_010379 [Pleurodeles waltl]
MVRPPASGGQPAETGASRSRPSGGGPRPHPRPRLSATEQAAGPVRSQPPGSAPRSLQCQDGGPAASRAGPLFTARFWTSDRRGMARLQATNESAPPERGD